MNANRRQAITKTAQLHRENLRRNLERRLEAARATGDQNLVKMLEAEANYIG
ncbi:arginine synthesis PII-interacting regulator PirA [Leptolyngbya ohadii]|uniref:arginine synthesis PII-interacting regulator PirA n=1 Tax=Leptolyngbya ohadii TaxID=1962290 RepID=UPI0015C5E889|nr:hypothetical protein [Leptolyngbya ohadii]